MTTFDTTPEQATLGRRDAHTAVDCDVLVDGELRTTDRAGFAPRAAVRDGIHAHPDGGPGGAILATSAVPTLPAAWIQQVHDGSASTNRTPTATGAPPHSGPVLAVEGGAAVMDLTTAQVHLLTAMAAPAGARIVDRVVRVATRTHSIKDLYALRTAKLVRAARDGRGLRDRKRFEITDHGVAEARRRDLAHIGTPRTPVAEPERLR
jgi:hypothetical protein